MSFRQSSQVYADFSEREKTTMEIYFKAFASALKQTTKGSGFDSSV